jgi:sulfite exporter TauE/SafE
MVKQSDHRAKVIPWPLIAGIIAVIVGVALLCHGLYILVGVGWALLAASVPFFLLAFVIFRGLHDG